MRLRSWERGILLAALDFEERGEKFSPEFGVALVRRGMLEPDGWLEWGDHSDDGEGPFGARRAYRLTTRGRHVADQLRASPVRGLPRPVTRNVT